MAPVARVWGDPAFERAKSRVKHSPEAHPEEQRGPRYAVMTHSDVRGTFLTKVAITSDNPEVVGSDTVFKHIHPDAVFYQWLSRADDQAGGLLVRVCLSDEHRRLPDTWRRYIFNRELGVVFDCFLHAEEKLLAKRPDLLDVPVFVHFQSRQPELDEIVCLGALKSAPRLATLVAHANRSFVRWEGLRPRFETKNWTFSNTPEQEETLYRLADRQESPSCPVGWKPDALKQFGRTSFSDASEVLPQVPTPEGPKPQQPDSPRGTMTRNNIVQFLRTGWPLEARQDDRVLR